VNGLQTELSGTFVSYPVAAAGRNVFGVKQWLCAKHYEEHVETRRFLHMDGEGLEALGAAVNFMDYASWFA
jgi:hypothetical protein